MLLHFHSKSKAFMAELDHEKQNEYFFLLFSIKNIHHSRNVINLGVEHWFI